MRRSHVRFGPQADMAEIRLACRLWARTARRLLPSLRQRLCNFMRISMKSFAAGLSVRVFKATFELARGQLEVQWQHFDLQASPGGPQHGVLSCHWAARPACRSGGAGDDCRCAGPRLVIFSENRFDTRVQILSRGNSMLKALQLVLAVVASWLVLTSLATAELDNTDEIARVESAR